MNDNRKILEYFIDQQEQLVELAGKSKLETLIIDSSGMNINYIEKKVFDFWSAF